jgi:REP element-mobilizing transposase RayT
MTRSRYVILEPDKPHFLTCTVVEWLPIFTRSDAVQSIFDSWTHQRLHDGLQLFGYVVLENHLHFVAQAPRLDKCLSSFKSYTAARIIELLEERKAVWLLARLRFAKLAHKCDRQYQFWQEGSHAEMIFSECVMREKLDYIHQNPVKRGYVDFPEHRRYSSARNYVGQSGLIEIDPWF